MGIEEKIQEVNEVLDLAERIQNLSGRGVLTPARAKSAKGKIEDYLDTVFPLPPPEE